MLNKVSEITAQDLAEFIHLDEVGEVDTKMLSSFLNVAKDYIKNYTGVDDFDEYVDFVFVVLILCQDMWDNRTMYVDSSNINKTVQTILDMHTRNNL